MIPVALDLETHLFGPGNLAPLPIVASIASHGEVLLTKDWRSEIAGLLQSRRVLLVGHNIAYDLACVYQHAPELRGLIWQAYDSGRVSDTGLRDRIILLADGRRTFDDSAKWASRPEPSGPVRPTFSLTEAVRRNLPDAADWAWWLGSKGKGTPAPADEDSPLLAPDTEAMDPWRTRYAELEHLAVADWPEAARRYAEADGLLTLRVWEAQRSMAANMADTDLPHLLRNEADQVQAAWALHLIAAWGLITDEERVADYETLWRRLSSSLLSKLVTEGVVRQTRQGATKDTVEIQRRVEAAFKRMDRPVPRTDSGRVSMAREALEATGDHSLLLLAEQTKLEKLIGTYLPVLKAGTDAPLHTRYEVMLETGRTSSSNPNLQNLPRDLFVRDYDRGGARVPISVREAFIPRAGNGFISVDYDTLELRTLAQVAHAVTGGKSVLAKVLNAGMDPHLDLAALMLKTTYEDAQARMKAGDGMVKRARTAAKPANFGYPGGLGAAAFADYARTYTGGELNLTEARAIEIKDYWTKKWPEMPAYFAYVESQRRAQSYNVRMPGSGLLRKGCTFPAACNCYFQSLAAHGAKRALYRVLRACYAEPASPLYGCHPVAFIHDEVILEAPLDAVHEAGVELSRLMCETMQAVVPDVRISASPAAMRRWYKGAEPVWSDGRLVPWEPKPTA